MKTNLTKAYQIGITLLLSFVLSACLKAVPDDDNEAYTKYGTFTTGSQADDEIDRYLRDLIDFTDSEARYQDGYSIKRSDSYALYTGLYSTNSPYMPESLISTLLDSISKKGKWVENYNFVYGTSGTVELKQNTFQNNANPNFTISVHIRYHEPENNYWIYLAIPSSMLEAADYNASEISSLFYQYRFNKK